MGGCQGARKTGNLAEDACQEIEIKLKICEIPLEKYDDILIKYACMGNLTYTQLISFCNELEISKKELETNLILKSFFEEFKIEPGKSYDSFLLKAIGIFYCQGLPNIKYEKLKFLLEQYNNIISSGISKDILQRLLIFLFGISCNFVPKKALLNTNDEKLKSELNKLCNIPKENYEKLISKWFPNINETEIKDLQDWAFQGNFNSMAARKIIIGKQEIQPTPK